MSRSLVELAEMRIMLMLLLILIQVGAILDTSSAYLFDWSPVGQPSFVDTPSHVRVKRGALAVLHCWIRQLGDRQVAWRRKADDTFLTIGKVTLVRDSNLAVEHVRKRNDVTTWDLVFRQARPENQGDYECQVTSQDAYVRTVTLTVLDEPLYSSHVESRTGDSLQLRCNVSTFNTTGPRLYWQKDGRHIDSLLHPFIYITRYRVNYSRTLVSDLTIDSLSLQDSGLYTCMTSSRHVIRVTKVTVTPADPLTNKREENLKENMSDAGQKLGNQVHPRDHGLDSVHNGGDMVQSSQQATPNSGSSSESRVWHATVITVLLNSLLPLLSLPPRLCSPYT